jgi:2-succinyl-5-enolpyruvyl-6-hydroxy-3-cyclohexene-1-carboxylate synthase
MNIALAIQVLKACQKLGVSEYCLCAGARNSPLVFLLAKAQGVRIHHFFEERSASFFALGRIKALGVPVAVVTTSGTAVAELLPAAVEGTYAGLPLVLITADRPRVYRGSGAPQSIEQMGIFSHYVQTTWDIESLEDQLPIETWAQKQPLQINVCFDEPLIDNEVITLDLLAETSAAVESVKYASLASTKRRKLAKPFVIVGGLNKKDREAVIGFLEKLQVPIYAESISGLRGEPRLQGKLIANGEQLIGPCFETQLCDTVLRLGSVPTLRFWRDLESKFSKVPVFSVSNEEWRGLSRLVHHMLGFQSLNQLDVQSLEQESFDKIIDEDDDLEIRKEILLQRYVYSEVALIQRLAQKLKDKHIYLGNSLPIREWDLVSPLDVAFADIEANRGANGIDGQISTFLGWTESKTGEAWAIVGDLTALYDLSSLWATRGQLKLDAGSQSETGLARRIVIINNSGGQIFKSIFQNEAFINSHEIGFQKWAEMWGWDYQLWTEIPQDIVNLPKNLIIELKPLGLESEQFWQGHQKK